MGVRAQEGVDPGGDLLSPGHRVPALQSGQLVVQCTIVEVQLAVVGEDVEVVHVRDALDARRSR